MTRFDRFPKWILTPAQIPPFSDADRPWYGKGEVRCALTAYKRAGMRKGYEHAGTCSAYGRAGTAGRRALATPPGSRVRSTMPKGQGRASDRRRVCQRSASKRRDA